MKFNKHLDLEGQHAFLSASKYHWLNYDEEKLVQVYSKYMAAQKGTELHALASELIRLRVKLPKNSQTLNMFVNDAIGYKMETEQPLYYSPNCFGTTDAISFKKKVLRIHDYKSGETKASMSQLMIYAAYFCLEYDVGEEDIDRTELRIYQSNEIEVYEPTYAEIKEIMDLVKRYDKIIETIKQEG